MSVTLILFVAAAVLSIVAMVLHVVMIVQGFKTSVSWGLVGLFVPLGSLIFGFARSGRPVMAGVLFVAIAGSGTCWGVASHKQAQALIGADETAAQGMQELENQINSPENLDDLQLDL